MSLRDVAEVGGGVLIGTVVGVGAKAAYDMLITTPPKDRADLISSISVITVRPTGETRLIPRCVKVSATRDPDHPEYIDEDSQWEFLGPEGIPEVRAGVHTWHFGGVYTVGITRGGIWETRIQAPGKPEYIFEAISGWNIILPGYLVLDFPLT